MIETGASNTNGDPLKETDGVEGGKPILQAKTVFLYMGSETRVSRSSRIQWLIDHLDEVVSVPHIDSLDKITKAIEIVSIIPEDHGGTDWGPDTSHEFQYYIHPHTKLLFLSRRYCLTYCLDMSPSLSAVDIQNGEVMMDKLFTCLKTSLEGVSKSFVLPGSTLVFYPEIYVSIIANTPFFITPAQQVLLQSWRVTSDNLSDLFKNIQTELLKLENAVAEVSDIFVSQLEATRVECDNIVGALFEEDRPKRTTAPSVAMVNPDQGFINMLRFGMLALRLLPAASCAGIIVVTDGVITLPDACLLDATLNRLRSTGVCCSFLHVGSPFHPHCGQGRVPYTDLMTFVASASLGVHMTNIPEVKILDFRDLQMNRYHQAFLSWSFQCFDPVRPNGSVDPDTGQWSISNPAFGSRPNCQLLKKKQLEESLNVPLVKMLCCRIREGYVVNSIHLTDSQIEIKLVLAWKYQIYLDCVVRSKWPPTAHTIQYSLFIKAPYEFLHDISCNMKKPAHAPFRQAVVSRFWLTLKNYVQSDYLMAHLHSKESNPHWNSIPESVRSGMPLFHSSSTGPGLSGSLMLSNDVVGSQFVAFWKPISLLDPDAWHKWLHTYRIGLILRHDYPLSKNLHLTNSSGRFQVIHCRQAATALQTMLRDVSTFVLVENKSFVKLVPPDGPKSTGWFYIIILTCKQPCVVINLAFPCGTPSKKRLSIVSDLKTQLCELSCSLSSHERLTERMSGSSHAPVSRKCSRVACCTVLQKPVEKILIRYKKIPSTFDTVVFPDGTQSLLSAKPSLPESGKSGYLVTTLSRYLHHKRWIWATQNVPGSSLGVPAIARILSTITEMRLKEGFSFAHSQAGIVNMLLEVQMQGNPELGEEVSRCVLQYVLFPPHAKPDESGHQVAEAESDDDDRDEGPLEIVTESWVEPHSGLVRGGPSPRSYMDHLPYNKLSDAIANADAQCISSLLTFEHLSLMARNKAVAPPASLFVLPDISQLKDRVIVHHDGVSICDDRIHYVPFLFNLVNILPRCRQAELLFSMPIQDLTTNWQVPSKLIDGKDSLNPDVKNASLMELIFDQLSKLHDRELLLTLEDSVQFVEHLHRRERNTDVHPVPIPKCAEGSSPGWRCYLKGIDPEHITLTFIPAGYSELKTLMWNKVSNGDSKSLKTLTLDDNSIGDFVDWGRKRQSGNSDQLLQDAVISTDRVTCHSTPVQDGKTSESRSEKRDQFESSFYSFESDESKQNNKSSLHNISTSESQLRSVCESNSLSGSQSGALESTEISFQRMFSAMTKPYRDRASSLDTNFDRARKGNLQTSYNLRTTSMEAKIWGNRSVNQSSGVTRSNTQASEMSGEHVDKSSNANSEDLMPSTDADLAEIQDSNKVFSTIPLPIFIYDCPLVNLIDSLVYKDSNAGRKPTASA